MTVMSPPLVTVRHPAVPAPRLLPGGAPTPEDILIAQERITALRKQMLALRDPRMEYMIRAYHGMNCDPMTLREIGERLDLSKERCRQIISTGQRILGARLVKTDSALRDSVKTRKRDLWEEALVEERRVVMERERIRKMAQQQASFVVVDKRDRRRDGINPNSIINPLVFGTPAGSKAPPSWYLNGRWLFGQDHE